jgi:hypothetical protein
VLPTKPQTAITVTPIGRFIFFSLGWSSVSMVYPRVAQPYGFELVARGKAR